MEYSIKPNAQMYTVLSRDCSRKVFVFVWDWFHWLSFNSNGKCQDIRYFGTGRTAEDARRIAHREKPGCEIIFKYCPRSCGW